MDGEGPRIAINGFGRIGRLVTRILLENDAPVDLVAVNDLTPNATLAHLFRYDSVHGRFPGHVEVTDDGLVLAGDRLLVLEEKDPSKLPWNELQPDVVIEASGRFTKRSSMQKHLAAGAPRVLLTAPSGDADLTVVRGVNDHLYDARAHRLVSNASCTTNALAPVLKVLNDSFGVERGVMTTIHAMTGDQSLVDGPHTDLRRARASMLSMIPTQTGAARAIGKVLPELDGKIDGLSIRVPTQDVSLVDLTVSLPSQPTTDAVLDALRDAARGPMQGILGLEDDPLVSIDFTHDSRSSIVDAPSIMRNGPMMKILAWYDNEWGYANRVAEMAHVMADSKSG
jgi:glyceraldehyde 3-phosphate dehydrogenase